MAEVSDLETRRNVFIDLISAYSEDRYSAGWMHGIEQEIRKDGGIWLAIATVTGWPQGYRAEDGWTQMTNEEWSAFADMAEGEHS